ncbi:glutamate formimidoyltransferase [bacterium]|nr:glutamate formimidoyltransferase [candidate division CSSED10-310 bacterium]
MLKLVECVPNFSEGRDMAVIDAITREIVETENARLLDVDPGADTNRTVVTFIGTPEAVKEAAFKAIKRAAQLIDMSRHSGAHPRMGATDVCPFVPVSGVTMDDCVAIAREVGERVGGELGIPVYLYEAAATSPARRSLADIRKGEYEALEDKLNDPLWKPDFGPAVFNPSTGAAVIGAREFLIAYNVNLNTKDKRLAHKVAVHIREGGRPSRDDEGNVVKDGEGDVVKIPGTLQECRAVGWFIPEYGCAQVSINLTNYKVTPPHVAFEEVSRFAGQFGMRVTGSELVGLMPKDAILMAGRYYLERQGKTPAVTEAELIRLAVQSMGLDSVSPFDPGKKIIEYQFSGDPSALVAMTVAGFADELSSDSPAPGGGSVAALSGALAGSLAAMVAALTHGKEGYEEVWPEMVSEGAKAMAHKYAFLADIDRDTQAFNKVMAAMRMRRKTTEQKEARNNALAAANLEATMIPFGVLDRCRLLIAPIGSVAEHGNQNSLSDAGVAALSLITAAEGAYYNVLINLQGLDSSLAVDLKARAKSILDEVLAGLERIRTRVREKLEV